MTEMMFPDQCIVHMTSYDSDCQGCKTELAAINKQESDTNVESAKIVGQLESIGYETDSMVIAAVKIDTLIDSLFISNAKQRAKFDAAVAVNLLREMVRQQAEVNRQRLLS